MVLLTLMYVVMRAVQALLPPQIATAAYGALVTVQLLTLQLAIINNMSSWLADWTAVIACLVIQAIHPAGAADGDGVLLVPLPVVGLTDAQSSFLMTCSGRYVLQRVFGGYNMLMWLVWGVLIVVLPTLAADVLYSSSMVPSVSAVCLYVVYGGCAVLCDIATSQAIKPRVSALYSSMSTELDAGTFAVEPHFFFDCLDCLERLVLGAASCISSIASPAGVAAACSSLCGCAFAAAAAGRTRVESTGTVTGRWVVGCFRRVLAALGLLHLITMPLQFMVLYWLLYATETLSSSQPPWFWPIPVAILQLVLLPGSPAFKKDGAWQEGRAHSWLLVASNYLFWTFTMVATVHHPSCISHPSFRLCSDVVPSSLFHMMLDIHYTFVWFWLAMTVGQSSSFQRFVTWLYWGRWCTPCSLPADTKLAWFAMLPVCTCLGPFVAAFLHLASFPATRADTQLPSVLLSVCKTLQSDCDSCGPEMMALLFSALAVLAVCVCWSTAAAWSCICMCTGGLCTRKWQPGSCSSSSAGSWHCGHGFIVAHLLLLQQ